MTADVEVAPVRLPAGSHVWLQAFAGIARAAILEVYRPDSCVASTRIGLMVLRHFGVRARPRSVTTTAFTQDRYELWAAGEEFDGVGYALGIGIGPIPGAIYYNAQGQRKWTGHMIIELRERPVLIDLSLDQASRPEQKLDLSPVVLDLGETMTDFHDGYQVRITDPRSGYVLLYQRVLDDTGNWRAEPDWTGNDAVSHGIVEKIIGILTPVTIMEEGS